MVKKFTHIDGEGNPRMVDVSNKKITLRTAEAEAVVHLGKDIINRMTGNELITKKGPVFQTAIIAGVMAAKRTHELIPFCHPLGLDDCQISIEVKNKKVWVRSRCAVEGKTGVEMEALTAASIASLTIYDMCKALSHDITIEEVKLMKKTGGKNNFERKT